MAIETVRAMTLPVFPDLPEFVQLDALSEVLGPNRVYKGEIGHTGTFRVIVDGRAIGLLHQGSKVSTVDLANTSITEDELNRLIGPKHVNEPVEGPVQQTGQMPVQVTGQTHQE